MTSRLLVPLPVPGDAGALEVMPRLAAALSGDGPALLPYAAGDVSPLDAGTQLTPDEDDPADPTAVVIRTSGSGGEAKQTLLPASAILASVSATHDRLGGPGRWLLALPADHVAGLQVLLRSLVSRTTPTVMDLAGGFTAAGFAAAVAAMGTSCARRYTSLVPTQLVRLLDAGGDAVNALTGFDAVLLGGAATAPALRQRAADAGVRLVTTYGMSETCGGCVYDGVPLDGVEVAIGDDGTIGLGGPVVARGYRGHAGTAGNAAFGVRDGVRWFTTSDAGRWEDGRLQVLGRVDDGILTGGLTVAPAAVEAALLARPEIAEAVVVGLPDAEWGQVVAAALVLRTPVTDPAALARTAVEAAGLGRPAVPRRVLTLDRLPLRGPGKPDRAAVARGFPDTDQAHPTDGQE